MRMIRTYDTHVYDFLGKVRKIFGGIDLSCMHHSFQVIPPAGAGDQATEVHEQFYAAFDELRPTYEDFLRDEIMPLFNEDLCAQAVPTFRVSGPGAPRSASSTATRTSTTRSAPSTSGCR
ncbi:hypothetical protein GCM10029964_078580 [Kibdelosporangium lantanae]